MSARLLVGCGHRTRLCRPIAWSSVCYWENPWPSAVGWRNLRAQWNSAQMAPAV